jgi:hypothetical protein
MATAIEPQMLVSLNRYCADRYAAATFLLLLAVGLAGEAHVAFLPPFEGFDETGHWSYVQQLAETGRSPRPQVDRTSADVEAYAGPTDSGAGRDYRAFFAGPAPDLHEPVARSFRPGRGPSEDAQHPPLYYLLLVPFYLLAKNWSWTGNMLLLRSVSWAFAFAGFAIGCRVSQRELDRLQRGSAAGLLMPAWPFLFPQFFPEMARLGNDSLCLLLMSVAWYFLLRALRNLNASSAAGLGVTLGLGLLTKALFLPITGGVVLLFAFAGLRSKDRRHIRSAIIAMLVAAVVGSAWYLRSYLETGHFIYTDDFASIGDNGDLLRSLMRGSALHETLHFLRGIAVMTVSFAWVGTWSLAALSPIFTLPVVTLMAWATVRWLSRLQQLPTEGVAPLFLAVPVILGLLFHQVVWVATDAGQMAGTPGWYLHILSGPLSLVLALGWRPRWPFKLLAIYAVLFHAVCWATQLSFFSGCAYKPSPHMRLRLDPGSCLIAPAHLAALGEPLLGAATLVTAVILGISAILLLLSRTGRFAADR